MTNLHKHLGSSGAVGNSKIRKEYSSFVKYCAMRFQIVYQILVNLLPLYVTCNTEYYFTEYCIEYYL